MFIINAIVDGSERNLGQGAIIAVVSILMVFLILALIILITYLVNLGIVSVTKRKAATESAKSSETAGKSIDFSDEDAQVAVLVASIDYRNETHKHIKVISVREIK